MKIKVMFCVRAHDNNGRAADFGIGVINAEITAPLEVLSNHQICKCGIGCPPVKEK